MYFVFTYISIFCDLKYDHTSHFLNLMSHFLEKHLLTQTHYYFLTLLQSLKISNEWINKYLFIITECILSFSF